MSPLALRDLIIELSYSRSQLGNDRGDLALHGNQFCVKRLILRVQRGKSVEEPLPLGVQPALESLCDLARDLVDDRLRRFIGEVTGAVDDVEASAWERHRACRPAD